MAQSEKKPPAVQEPWLLQSEKKPPAVQEPWLQSLDQGDPLGKGTTTHSSILAWRIPRTDEPGGESELQCEAIR